MNIIEKASNKVKDIKQKISNTDSLGKKVLWILALIGLGTLILIPFIVYFSFFRKDTVIEVDVEADVVEVENNTAEKHDEKTSNSAVEKGEDILKNIDKLKKAKKDLKEL